MGLLYTKTSYQGKKIKGEFQERAVWIPGKRKKKVEKNFRWIPRGPCLEKTTATVVKKNYTHHGH